MLLWVMHRPSEKIRGGYWLYVQLDTSGGSQVGHIRGNYCVSRRRIIVNVTIRTENGMV